MDSQAITTTGNWDQFEPLKALVLDSLSSPHSRRAYATALTGFLEWYANQPAPGFTKATVQRYRAKLEGPVAG
jgi:hypothetical protein